MSVESNLPETTVTTRPKSGTVPESRRIPPYNVILENDDYHTFEFVIEVLCKTLGCAVERAAQFALEAHNTGRCIIWTGPREVAELKQEQVQSFNEIRERDGVKLGPLGCLVEPAPGA